MRLLAVEGAQARVDITDDPEELRLIVRELLSGLDFAPPLDKTNIGEIEASNSEETFGEIYCSGCGEVETCECPDPCEPELPRTSRPLL
ncbi:putative Histidine kinase [Prochlorococcus sp. MIT 0702]|nr:putative Histidine kinase [Prochlorococcus sp. MIT 0702]